MIYSREEVVNNEIPKNKVGLYYFMDASDKILYIGKSNNIKIRLQQHLKNGRKRMLAAFSKVKLKVLHTELEALLLESQEIKKHLPIFNRRLRKSKHTVSLVQEMSDSGYRKFVVKAHEPNSIVDFYSKKYAENFLRRLTDTFDLCTKINGLDHSSGACFQYHLKSCNGACIGKEISHNYNKRFEKSISNMSSMPVNATLLFKDALHSTFVNIKNKRVVSFGVTNSSHYKINFPSIDEIKIVMRYRCNILPTVKLM